MNSDARQDLITIAARLRVALGKSRGKIRVADALLLAGFVRRTQHRAALVGRAMHQLGWERARLRFDGALQSAFARGSLLEREIILTVDRNAQGPLIVVALSPDDQVRRKS